ncbi:MAG: histone deacetylase [Elusimicrobia bacterium]|nr:histone deacetylase [Elusimicrobiota bacterium]
MSGIKVYSDLSTTTYRTPGHPEAPERVSRSYERLKAAGHAVLAPVVKAGPDDVALMHSKEHFESVREGRFRDADTPYFPDIAQIALTSLSGALSAADSAAAGEPAFSLMRPPGHHAGRSRVSGFCYFNNLAIAVARLRKETKSVRISILDVDVHHGDGTDELMTGKDGVHFTSLHQSPLYPGTGLASHDNCFNYPLPPGTGEAAYLKALEAALRPALDFKPDLLAISAGFDTYKECPIAQLKLEKKSYRRIGAMIAETKLRRFAVLEGGYASELPVLIEEFLAGLA